MTELNFFPEGSAASEAIKRMVRAEYMADRPKVNAMLLEGMRRKTMAAKVVSEISFAHAEFFWAGCIEEMSDLANQLSEAFESRYELRSANIARGDDDGRLHLAFVLVDLREQLQCEKVTELLFVVPNAEFEG